MSSGGASSAGGALPNVGGTPSAGGAAGGSGSGGIEGSGGASLSMVAEELDGLIVDSRCDAATQPPLANGATCQHLAGMQHVETAVQLGGDAGTVYQVKLRVRGIWEPTNITGGTKGPESFTVGGMVTPGSGSDSDAVNYQQFFLEVAEPKQTYWLNNYPMLGHVIHKEDYEVTIPMAGETEVKVIKNDGNGRQIANFPGEKFDDLPPYDQTATLGQLLHLDVLEVTVEP